MSLNAPRVTLALILAIVAGCVAPVARSSDIRKRLNLDICAGPTLFNGLQFVDDTTRLFGFRTERALHLGGQAAIRASYGFGPRFGLDLTAGLSIGKPLQSQYRKQAGWLLAALAAKWRPWECNDAFLFEYRLTEFATSVGWVHGFPRNGREAASLTLLVGNCVTFYFFNPQPGGLTAERVLPAVGQAALAYNLYTRAGRFSPCVALTGGYNWETKTPGFGAAMAGMTWSPLH